MEGARQGQIAHTAAHDWVGVANTAVLVEGESRIAVVWERYAAAVVLLLVASWKEETSGASGYAGPLAAVEVVEEFQQADLQGFEDRTSRAT